MINTLLVLSILRCYHERITFFFFFKRNIFCRVIKRETSVFHRQEMCNKSIFCFNRPLQWKLLSNRSTYEYYCIRLILIIDVVLIINFVIWQVYTVSFFFLKKHDNVAKRTAHTNLLKQYVIMFEYSIRVRFAFLQNGADGQLSNVIIIIIK